MGLSVVLAAGALVVASAPAEAATKTAITIQPKSLTWERGNAATFTVKAKGSKLSYRWYVKKKKGRSYVPVSSKTKGSRSATLTVVANKSNNGSKYRVVVRGSKGTVTSKAATLKTIAASTRIVKNPKSITVSDGATVLFLGGAKSKEKITYQWFRRKAGSKTWKAVSTPDSRGTALGFRASYASVNKSEYKIVARTKNAVVSSKRAVLTVRADATRITSDVQSATINRYGSGTSATFTVGASGSALSYQWQSQAPGTSTWAAIGSATATSYTASSSSWSSGTSFRVVVSGANGTATSSAATLTVVSPTNTPAADAASLFGLSGLSQGVDVSAYQYTPTAKLNLPAVASWAGSGGFTILRNGSGAIPINDSYTDRCTNTTKSTGSVPVVEDCAYAGFADSSQSAGLRLGHYWFNGWISSVDTSDGNAFSGEFTSNASARQFVAWLLADGNYTTSSTDPLVLDIETGSAWTKTVGGKSVTLTQRAWNPSESLSFLNTVKSTLTSQGYNANLYVYMSASVANQTNSSGSYSWNDVAGVARLWVASWGSNNGRVPSSQPSVGPWAQYGGWSIWQYTSNASVSGSGVGRLDGDIAKSDAWTPR